jgi:uncharacterized protein YbcI
MQATQSGEHLEAAIARAVSHYEYDVMGGSYADIEVSVLRDVIVVRLLRGVPTLAEQRLAGTEHGRALMRQLHHALFDQYRDDLKGTVATLTASSIKNAFMDIDVPAGEKVIVLTVGSEGEEQR